MLYESYSKTNIPSLLFPFDVRLSMIYSALSVNCKCLNDVSHVKSLDEGVKFVVKSI